MPPPDANTFLLDYLSVKCEFKSKSQFLIQTSATMKGYCLLVVDWTAQVPDTPGLPGEVHPDGEERLQVPALPQLVLLFHF